MLDLENVASWSPYVAPSIVVDIVLIECDSPQPYRHHRVRPRIRSIHQVQAARLDCRLD
ncbi:unnamed protein product, partial [Candidula unifasciata]